MAPDNNLTSAGPSGDESELKTLDLATANSEGLPDPNKNLEGMIFGEKKNWSETGK